MQGFHLLTGRCGSGKSAVAAELRKLGYPVIEFDIMFKDLVTHDPAIRGAIHAKFGDDATGDFGPDVPISPKLCGRMYREAGTFEWMIDHVGSRLITVMQETRGLLLSESKDVFLETPVIYRCLGKWLDWVDGISGSLSAQARNPICKGRPLPAIKEFHIDVSGGADERIDRLVEREANRLNLYLGDRVGLFFHSREEVARNKEIVETLRQTYSTLDGFHEKYEKLRESCYLTQVEVHKYLNDSPDAPEKIAAEINSVLECEHEKDEQ